jgi:hypothetical protein
MKSGSGIESAFNLQSTPRSADDSGLSNKYTDTPRARYRPEPALPGHETESPGQESLGNSLLASRTGPVNWFSVAPDSEYEVSVIRDQATNRDEPLIRPEPAHQQDYMTDEHKMVQPIALFLKDRVPGSSKRVSAGSQDRQTATRDESSRLAEQKDISHERRRTQQKAALWKFKEPVPYFSFLTHSELLLDKSQIPNEASRDGRPLVSSKIYDNKNFQKRKHRPELEIETNPIEVNAREVEITDPAPHKKNNLPNKQALLDQEGSEFDNEEICKSYMRSSIREGVQAIQLTDLFAKRSKPEAVKNLKDKVKDLFEPPSRTINLKKLLAKPAT